MHSLILAALITVVPAAPDARMGRKITVLLDVSGSLAPHRAAALEAALEVVQLTATDDTEIRVGTFGGGEAVTPWLGWPVDLRRVSAWLLQHTPWGSTTTTLHRAWAAALAEGDVIVVTDGMIDDAARIARPKGRTVGVVLVGDGGAVGEGFAKRVANGGVYRVAPAPTDEQAR